jgi:hypothetical protein
MMCLARDDQQRGRYGWSSLGAKHSFASSESTRETNVSGEMCAGLVGFHFIFEAEF